MYQVIEIARKSARIHRFRFLGRNIQRCAVPSEAFA